MNDSDIGEEILELNKQHGNVTFISPLFLEESEITIEEKVEQWKAAFGVLSPKQVYTILSKDFDTTNITILENPGEVILFHRLRKSRVSVDLNLPSPDSSTIRINSVRVHGVQDNGIGPKAIQNLVRCIEGCFPDTKKIDLLAHKAGSYWWARLGFVPEIPVWRDVIKEIKIRRELIREQLPLKTNKALDIFFSQEYNPKIIGSIADMDYSTITLPKETPGELGNFFENNQPTLGKYLLINNNWRGYLDLSDKKAESRLKGYLSRLDLAKIIPIPKAKQAQTQR